MHKREFSGGTVDGYLSWRPRCGPDDRQSNGGLDPPKNTPTARLLHRIRCSPVWLAT
jgi:hypothetical protein